MCMESNLQKAIGFKLDNEEYRDDIKIIEYMVEIVCDVLVRVKLYSTLLLRMVFHYMKAFFYGM